jgi:8-oxo-dGTP pyrophosphatase MutT (NUDIX family)
MSTDPAAELVTVLDDDGNPCDVVTRARIRRENLLHGATAIVVRRSDGGIYVHRRTATKDIHPGAYDCWAGGVLGVGEEPAVGAARELFEELGIAGAPLRWLLTTRWESSGARAIYHVYEVVWDGEIVHQPTEVDWGAWWTLDDLATRLADPSFVFAPDGRALLDVTGLLQNGALAVGKSSPS